MESLIAQIHKDKMNSICFDCGAQNPDFVSINNGIFLCNKCATVHMSFPQGVSNIENNDLYSLSEHELKFLAEGGNTSLNDFILDEFPKLENYSQKLLYKTRAMDYYRKRLYYYIYGGIEPKRPSSIVGCQLIPDNHYTKNNYERNIPKKFEPKTKTYKPEEHAKPTKYKDEFDEFFNDPFMNPDKFGNEKDMFKKFFGKDFFGMDHDDFFDFDGKKNLNKTTYDPNPKTQHQYQYQERPKNQYTTVYNDRNRNANNYSNNTYNNNNYNSNTYNINEKQPMDNYTKKAGPYTSNYVYRSQRPSAPSTTTVPSRKDKYMKRNVQNDNNSDKKNNYNTEQANQNVNRGGTVNPMKYMKSSYRSQYSKPDEKEKEAEREKEREEKEREREREREEREREEREKREKEKREKEKREKERENQKEAQTNRYNTNNNDNNNKKSYDPFKRRDSTDLITLPGMENSNLVQKNKKKQKPQEIPAEFSKQASGLGQITDAINENDNESISSQSNSISNSNSNSDSESNKDDNEFSEELKKIPEHNTHKKVENNNNEDDDITFKNSIRNKYKKRKSQVELEKKQEEEKLKSKARPINNNNTVYESKYSNRKNARNENNNNDYIKKKPSKKNNEFKSKKSGGIHNDGANPQFNKSYARRLSKMNITSSNWNINQLGDINTYPEVIEVEGLIFY